MWPLIEHRQTLLKKHREYMRLTKLDDIKEMTKEEINGFMKFCHQIVSPHDDSLEALQTKLRDIQHTRTLATWHDHSTILNTGYNYTVCCLGTLRHSCLFNRGRVHREDWKKYSQYASSDRST